ncbi:unnamed protein product [Phyllotreta striolata]|uniref:DM10 domain-containing protein n=1 Tax=Phyllotreta striolata TaxID=444603 RepID=A0A9N9TDD7_PHYSR|nr:unnamed protein product [Phyllotreta striolata]
MADRKFDYTDRLNFLGEWFDHKCSYLKHFIIKFYPSDNTLELYDKDLGRMFLKRTKMEEITTEDMFVGNTIRVYGRQIKITDYLDCRTQNNVGKYREKTCLILKPMVLDKIGEILTVIERNGFAISKLRLCSITRKEAMEFYAKRKGDPILPSILENLVSGPVLALALIREDAVKKLQDLLGPADPEEAKLRAPHTLRALYGHSHEATNGFHCSEAIEDGPREIEFFFSINERSPEPVALFENTTCCLIKPHAVQEGNVGRIVKSITDSHFKITGAHVVYLSSLNADEFLEVYKGVVSDYHAFKDGYLNGPCVVLEIGGKLDGVDAQEEFRKLCGPMDSEIARQIRPHTLRAQFGRDKYLNAVHCTDLPEDVVLELEYLFRVLKDV